MSGGAHSRNKGNRAEQHLARYLSAWWPHACRAVRTGSSAAPDPGDIANVPFIVSCKNVDARRASWPSTWAEWWTEVDDMRADDPVALAFIVEKKAGHTDPGMWWAHLYLDDLVRLRTTTASADVGRDRTPVRLKLADLVELLVEAGYARDPRPVHEYDDFDAGSPRPGSASGG